MTQKTKKSLPMRNYLPIIGLVQIIKRYLWKYLFYKTELSNKLNQIQQV